MSESERLAEARETFWVLGRGIHTTCQRWDGYRSRNQWPDIRAEIEVVRRETSIEYLLQVGFR